MQEKLSIDLYGLISEILLFFFLKCFEKSWKAFAEFIIYENISLPPYNPPLILQRNKSVRQRFTTEALKVKC